MDQLSLLGDQILVHPRVLLLDSLPRLQQLSDRLSLGELILIVIQELGLHCLLLLVESLFPGADQLGHDDMVAAALLLFHVVVELAELQVAVGEEREGLGNLFGLVYESVGERYDFLVESSIVVNELRDFEAVLPCFKS